MVTTLLQAKREAESGPAALQRLCFLKTPADASLQDGACWHCGGVSEVNHRAAAQAHAGLKDEVLSWFGEWSHRGWWQN